jgi:hypothetical protein
VFAPCIDDAAARLAGMIDLCSAHDWSPASPAVFALMARSIDDPADVRTVSFPLDVTIPEAVARAEPDAECVAIAVSRVFAPTRAERRKSKSQAVTARLTVAVTDCDVAAVYRYLHGPIRRKDTVGEPLRAQLDALWQARIRFELERRRTVSEGLVSR